MKSPESRSGHRPGRTFEEELNLRYLSPGAFTVLSPEDHGPPPDPPQAPPPYRFSPSQKRRKNQAFSIIAEPDPRSRSPSPSGRVSPFKGRGFNPSGSRHVSPCASPPPEDTRIINYSCNDATSKKSQIPQLKRRSNSIIFSEDGDSSPTYPRKNASLLKPQLSRSLNNIGPKNVPYKPPPNPKRFPTYKGFNRLSPIIGSSPEPSSDSKSLSSPSRIPKSRSTPPSRKQSPCRDSSPDYKPPVSRANSRANISRNNSRNASRNPSREPSPSSKPPFSPTRIPTRSYKNVQAKVNSYNAKSTTNKVPISKIQESTKTENIRGRKLERTDSVNKVVSKNVTSRYLNSNKTVNTNFNKTGVNNNNKTANNNFQIKIGSTPNSNAGNKSASNTNINKNSNLKNSNSNLTHAEKKKSLTKTTKKEDQDNNNVIVGKGVSNVKNTSAKNEEVTTSKKNVVETKDINIDNSKPAASKLKDSTTKTESNTLKKVESLPKISEMLPSATTVVSTTTTTVTQPLKIEAKLDTPLKKDVDPMKPKPEEKLKPKETPMYMDEGRVLSAKSVSSAMERMNDTVLDSQTLLKDHNMSKLSPAASAIISLSNDNNPPASKSVAAALPNVETVKNRVDAISQNVNSSVSNTTNHLKADAVDAGNNVKNNIDKLISPDGTFGAKVNNYEKSANDRIKEARTLVASDVKPIRITVQEKPNNVEVQSGNVRFPNSATNGINSGSSAPPPQNGNQQPEPPKSRCQTLMDRCRNKMPCACCKPKPKSEDESTKKGCFGCLKKNKKEVEEIIVSNAEDAEKAKKSCLERLKCCRSNKVGDETTGCCGRNKRKDSWASRRDSILSEPVPLTRGAKCKNFFKKIFCCGAACCACCKRSPKMVGSASRRASMLSKKKSLTPTVLPPEEPKTKLDTSLVEYTSTMKAAIPVLPVALAYFCLFFNIFAPGTGTVFSGLFCLCMGIPRFSQRDGPKPRFGSFVINTIIGCGQLFTVLFCLVGWGWSIWWGVIMIKVAKKHRKLKKIEKRLEAQEAKAAAAAAATNANNRDVEKGRS